MLSGHALCKSFGQDRVLDEVAYSIQAGQVILLQGENGAGKSTLLDIMSGQVPADSGRICLDHPDEGCIEITYPRRRLSIRSAAELLARSGVARTWQDSRLFASLTLAENAAVGDPRHPGESAWRVLLQPLRTVRYERKVLRAARDLLEYLQLLERADSKGDLLSLGQEKRLAVARSLQQRARVLLLDEPLAGLDSTSIDLITKFVGRLVRRGSISAVIAEHSSVAASWKPMLTQVWHLSDGRLTEKRLTGLQTTTSFIGQLHTSYPTRAVELPGGARLLLVGNGLANACDAVHDISLRVSNLRIRTGVRDRLAWADGVTFAIQRGQAAILLAPNGWGKTSLLDAVAGLLPAETGAIELHGEAVQRSPSWRRSQLGLRYIPARDTLFESLTMEENWRLIGVPPPDRADLRGRPLRLLSGGERRQLSLLAAESHPFTPTKVVMVDEPFSGLDSSGVRAAWELLKPAPGRTTFITTPLSA